MKFKNIFIALGLTILFFSCGQNVNNSKKNEASMTKKEKKMAQKDQPKDLTKLGMKSNPNYELGGLPAGSSAPLFDKPTHLGTNFNLKNELAKNPVVVVFYRGYWCPVCHRHLSQFQDDLDAARKDKDFTVVAVTPEQFVHVEKTVEKDGLTIPVIYDDDESIMKNYKVAFEVTEDYQKKIKNFKNQDIATNNGKDHATLPVPATYIIGQDGKIVKSFYDPNYKNRASVSDIVAFL